MKTKSAFCLFALFIACLPAWSQPQMDSSMAIADRIVASKIPVLVDFWAAWCRPCRLVGPIIEEIKKEYAGKIHVIKVNVDVHRQLAAYFKISSIPAVFIIANRTVVDYLPGLQPKESYKQAIEKALKDAARSPAREAKKTDVKPSPQDDTSHTGGSSAEAEGE